jgi:hypothetical protein
MIYADIAKHHISEIHLFNPIVRGMYSKVYLKMLHLLTNVINRMIIDSMINCTDNSNG